MNLTARLTDWLRTVLVERPVPRSVASLRINRRRKAAIALSVAVAAVVFFQLALGIAAECSLYIRDPGYSDKEVRLARQEALIPGTPRVVMLGTSRTSAAFHAGRVREQLGGRAVVFNFGIPASGPITHIIYLKRLLADGHRPDLLILEVLPPTLMDLPAGPTTPAGPLEGRFFFGDRMRHGELDAAIDYGFPADDVRRKWKQSIAVPWYALRFPIMGRVMPSASPWHLRFDWSRGCDEFGWGGSLMNAVTPEQFAKGLQQAQGEYRAILADLKPNGGGGSGTRRCSGTVPRGEDRRAAGADARSERLPSDVLAGGAPARSRLPERTMHEVRLHTHRCPRVASGLGFQRRPPHVEVRRGSVLRSIES